MTGKHEDGMSEYGVSVTRLMMNMDIVRANKREEPFASEKAFKAKLNKVEADYHDYMTLPPRDEIVELLASHYWDSYDQRRSFKERVFGVLYGHQHTQTDDVVNELPLNQPDEVAPLSVMNPQSVLADMLGEQREHMLVYTGKYKTNGVDFPEEGWWGQINTRATQAAIRMNMGFLIEELMEAQNLLKAKPWKMSYSDTDPAEWMSEVGDTIHFFLEFLILAGFDTSEKVYACYMEKSRVNHQRQQNGY